VDNAEGARRGNDLSLKYQSPNSWGGNGVKSLDEVLWKEVRAGGGITRGWSDMQSSSNKKPIESRAQKTSGF